MEAGANGDGTSTNPAGNITYVLKNLVTANTFDVIQVRPGEYNNTIELFPLTISTPNVSLTSTHGASVTIINGSEITDSIRVTASNVKINGFTIKNCGGGVHGAGIFLNVTSNIRITGNTLYHNYGDGVRLGYSRNTRVTGNFLIHNSDFGIYLSESSTITITGNTISGNWYGVGLFGELYESNDIRISGNTITYQFKGIFMGGMNETTITGNTFTNNNQGIELAASYETTIMDNTITNNDWRGIRLTDASGATITGNTITNSDTGIYLWSSRGNTIMGNIITDNNNYGIWLRSSSTGNLVYRNDFLNNGVNAEDTCGGNAFNNSTIGNYWDDYTGRDVDYEGIGDTPHSIPGLEGSMDYLPSMDPFEAEERGWTELKPLVIAGPGLEYLLLSLPVTIPLVAVVIYTYKKKRE
ncbi:MAG: hypothetical protein GWO20_10260 [Candidatus Korarchaeota archaeon]|nr:hypothetical protein [Candidatus Korarchaeota archaeon]